MSQKLEELWDVTEVCTALRVARSTVYDWVHAGFVPHVKLGTCVRFRPSDIQAWIDQKAHPGRVTRVPEIEP